MGRGSGASGARGGGGGGSRSLTSSEISSKSKEIDSAGFNKVGKNSWEMPTDPQTGIGASINRETAGSITQYAVQTWSRDDISITRTFSSLNAAKTAAKEEMKGWLPSVRVKG